MSDFEINTTPLVATIFGGTAMSMFAVQRELRASAAAARSARNSKDWHALYARQRATVDHLVQVARHKDRQLADTAAHLQMVQAELATARAQLAKAIRAQGV